MTAINSLVEFEVTLTPPTTTPLVDYPANGWTYYRIEASAGSSNQAFICQ